jgi:hypothetical protein
LGINLFFRFANEQAEKAQFTTPQIKRLRFGDRIAGALACVLLGGLCALIPLIGWLIAIASVFAAVAYLATPKDDLATVEGECPHCDFPLVSTFGVKTLTCKNCRNTVVFKQGHFATVTAVTDPNCQLPDIAREINIALRGKRTSILTLLICLVAALLLFFLFLVLRSSPKTLPSLPTVRPVPTAAPQPAVTPAPTPSIASGIYMQRRIAITTAQGVKAIASGDEVRIVLTNSNGTLVIENEKVRLTVPPDAVGPQQPSL